MGKNKNMLASVWVVLGVVGRIIPHPANVTPMTSIALFGGAKLSRGKALLISLAAMLMSDILLGKLEGHAAFGLWSIFTYSGFAAIVLAGGFLKNPTSGRTLGFLVSASLAFWVWTNFGTWLVEGLYPHTAAGLAECYAMAVPFLRNALLGDLVWGLALFLSFSYVEKRTLQEA